MNKILKCNMDSKISKNNKFVRFQIGQIWKKLKRKKWIRTFGNNFVKSFINLKKLYFVKLKEIKKKDFENVGNVLI